MDCKIKPVGSLLINPTPFYRASNDVGLQSGSRAELHTPEKLSSETGKTKIYCANCFNRLFPEKRPEHCKSECLPEIQKPVKSVRSEVAKLAIPFTSRVSKNSKPVISVPRTHRDYKSNEDSKKKDVSLKYRVEQISPRRKEIEKTNVDKVSRKTDESKSIQKMEKELSADSLKSQKQEVYKNKINLLKCPLYPETHIQQYELLKEIGVGTFGKAVLVRDLEDPNHSLYVMKIINISLLGKKEMADAINEVRVISLLRHPFIISYKESFQNLNRICIIMEYAKYGDLFQAITLKKKANELFTEKQILLWFTQALLALKYLHDKHILHRVIQFILKFTEEKLTSLNSDLKSQNMFLTTSGRLCLGDFGIAKLMNKTCAFAHTQVGTPYFLSPEICRNKPYTWASDVWALGCVLYELMTLKVPFQANSLSGLVLKITRYPLPIVSNPKYSASIKQLLYDCLNRDWRLRPTVAEILEKDFVKKEALKIVKEYRIENVYNQKSDLDHFMEKKYTDKSVESYKKYKIPPSIESSCSKIMPKQFFNSGDKSYDSTSSKNISEKCLQFSDTMKKELKKYTYIFDKCIEESTNRIRRPV